MSRPLLAVVLAGMLLLAGCSGAPGTTTDPTVTDSTTAPTDSTVANSTATPSPSPTATEVPATGTPPAELSFPNGTNADGIDNASALIEAHFAALNESTYRVRATQTHNDGPEEFLVAEAGERVRIRSDSGVTLGRNTWSTANQTVGRTEDPLWSDDDSVSYTVNGRGTLRHELAENLPSLYATVPLTGIGYGEFAFAGVVDHDGDRLLRFVATDANESVVEAQNRLSISSYDATLLVSENGMVHEATVDMRSQNATYRGENGTYFSNTEYTATTGVEPRPPSWLSNVPDISVSLTGNGSLLAIENDGTVAVENATVNLGPFGPYETIEGPFEPGETRYLGVEADSGDLVLASERPDTAGLQRLHTPVRLQFDTENVEMELRAGE